MKEKLSPKTLRLKPDVIKKIEKLADEENRTFSNMVETILIKYNPLTIKINK